MASNSTTNNKNATNNTRPLFILYGSATGNAEHIAKDLAVAYETARHQQQHQQKVLLFDSVICCEMDQFKKKCLPLWELDPVASNTGSSSSSSSSSSIEDPQVPPTVQTMNKHGVLIVVSTTGNGDAPENAGRFCRHMKRSANAKSDNTNDKLLFRHVAYAVLGLGDTNYDQFCATAVMVDRKLHDLGGTRIRTLACADEAIGLEDVVEPWTTSILEAASAACFGSTTTTTTTSSSSNTAAEPTTAAAVTTTVLPSSSSEPFLNAQSPVGVLEEQNAPTAASPVAVSVNGDATSTPLPFGVPTTTTTRSLGVQMVESLLPSNDSQASSPLLAKDDDTEQLLLLQRLWVDPSTLPPPLLPSRSTTSAFHTAVTLNDEDEDPATRIAARPRGHSVSSAGVAEDSVSSVSAGYHFTARNPFVSTVVRARYLTATSTTAAKAATTIAATAVGSDEDGWLRQATEIYDAEFPLAPPPLYPSKSNEGKDEPDHGASLHRNGKRVIELTLSLPDDYTLEYAPGDSLGLLVDNPPEAVAFVLDKLSSSCTTRNSNGSNNAKHHQQLFVCIDDSAPVSAATALACEIDLSTVVKNKRLLYALAQEASDPVEKACLQLLSSKSELGEAIYNKMVDDQRMNVVDLLRAFPSTQQTSLENLLSIVPGIPPRYYSVSSSPLQQHQHNNYPTQHQQQHSLTIAFSVVDYLTPSWKVAGHEWGHRRIHGLATRHLEAISSALLAATTTGPNSTLVSSPRVPTVRIFPKPTADFRMPSMLSTPIVLIGPGTGIAPFMGFLHHRHALTTQHNREATATAQTVVEGTWRGAFELEENELHLSRQDESGLNVGADFRTQTLLSSSSVSHGSVDVFFGCRHADHDWLYREEMKSLHAAGVVTKLYTAFSRTPHVDSSNDDDTNGEAKHHHKYVQHIMLSDPECGDRLVDLIVNQNAAVYLCGDGNVMAKDVQAAIVELLSAQSLKTDETSGADSDNIIQGIDQAKAYLEEMKKKQRFLIDIWS